MEDRNLYQELMTSAAGHERLGRHRDAAQEALRALVRVEVGSIEWRLAMHLAAINFRLAREWDQSRTCFKQLLASLPVGSLERRRVLRDYSMLLVDMGELETALVMIGPVCCVQSNDLNTTEYGASVSIRARIYALKGDVDRALEDFEEADRLIRTSDGPVNHVYRLNNMVWWMKYCSPIDRLRLALIGAFLALRTSYTRRLVEVLILAVGGNQLYERLRPKS